MNSLNVFLFMMHILIYSLVKTRAKRMISCFNDNGHVSQMQSDQIIMNDWSQAMRSNCTSCVSCGQSDLLRNETGYGWRVNVCLGRRASSRRALQQLKANVAKRVQLLVGVTCQSRRPAHSCFSDGKRTGQSSGSSSRAEPLWHQRTARPKCNWVTVADLEGGYWGLKPWMFSQKPWISIELVWV